jgi:hypothetical protein
MLSVEGIKPNREILIGGDVIARESNQEWSIVGGGFWDFLRGTWNNSVDTVDAMFDSILQFLKIRQRVIQPPPDPRRMQMIMSDLKSTYEPTAEEIEIDRSNFQPMSMEEKDRKQQEAMKMMRAHFGDEKFEQIYQELDRKLDDEHYNRNMKYPNRYRYVRDM